MKLTPLHLPTRLGEQAVSMIRARPKAVLASVALSILAALVLYRLVVYSPDVVVMAATDGGLIRTIHGPGTVQSRFPVTVSPRITAAVTELYADQGDAVRRGQILARLDDRDLAARMATARASLTLARASYHRNRVLFERGFLSQAALDVASAALRAAEASEREAAAALSYAQIAAPFDGVITARTAELGHIAGPGDSLFRLVNPRALWVVARMDESEVANVSVGQHASIELRSGGRYAGTIARIGLESDAAARELEIDITFDEPPRRFAIGEEAEVLIHAGEARGITIPASAVFQLGRERGVLVVVEGRAQFRSVETGIADGERVIAHSGINSGDLVVGAPDQIRAGARVTAVLGGDS